jgi:hypothetical protein
MKKNNNMNVYVADELSNKVRCLSLALSQAKDIISKLENENDRLKDVLINLASSNNEGYVLDSEAFNESVCAA